MSGFQFTRDRLLGFVSIISGIIIFVTSMGIKSRLELNEPGPALFPRICAGGFLIFGSVLFVRKPKGEDKVFITKEGWGRVLVLYLILMAYVFIGLEYVGYLVSTPILLFALYMILAEKEQKQNPVKTAALALGVGLFLYLFFRKGVGVPLPAGKILPVLGFKG